MRSYSSLLVFETVYDSVDSSDRDTYSLAEQVFHPHLPVVENDCGTRLGEVVQVNFETEGRIELATGLPISRDRILALLSQGTYTVATRTLSTCISKGGICSKCYAASRPFELIPSVGSVVSVSPLYERSTEVLYTSVATSTFTLSTDADSYDSLLLYRNGQLQDPASYSVSGTVLTLNQQVEADSNLVARLITETRAPFMLYLADTYSGSLLGIKPLPRPLLPVRSLLLNEIVPEGLLDYMVEETKNSSAIPPNMLEYLGNIKDKLERSLFLIALRVIYNNVQS